MGYLASLLFIFIPLTSRWNSVFSYVGIVDVIKRRRPAPAPSLLGFLSIAGSSLGLLSFVHSLISVSVHASFHSTSFVHPCSQCSVIHKSKMPPDFSCVTLNTCTHCSIDIIAVCNWLPSLLPSFLQSFLHSFHCSSSFPFFRLHSLIHWIFSQYPAIRNQCSCSCKKQNY